MKELTKKQIKDRYDKLTVMNKKIIALSKKYRTVEPIKGDNDLFDFKILDKKILGNKPNNDISKKIKALNDKRKNLIFEEGDIPNKHISWWMSLKSGISKRDSAILEAVLYSGIYTVLRITKK